MNTNWTRARARLFAWIESLEPSLRILTYVLASFIAGILLLLVVSLCGCSDVRESIAASEPLSRQCPASYRYVGSWSQTVNGVRHDRNVCVRDRPTPRPEISTAPLLYEDDHAAARGVIERLRKADSGTFRSDVGSMMNSL